MPCSYGLIGVHTNAIAIRPTRNENILISCKKVLFFDCQVGFETDIIEGVDLRFTGGTGLFIA